MCSSTTHRHPLVSLSCPFLRGKTERFRCVTGYRLYRPRNLYTQKETTIKGRSGKRRRLPPPKRNRRPDRLAQTQRSLVPRAKRPTRRASPSPLEFSQVAQPERLGDRSRCGRPMLRLGRRPGVRGEREREGVVDHGRAGRWRKEEGLRNREELRCGWDVLGRGGELCQVRGGELWKCKETSA